MIYINTGKTGSGKTYRMIRDAYKQWYKGVDIYSNTILFFVNFGGQAGVNIADHPQHFSKLDHVADIIQRLFCKLTRRKYQPIARGKIEYFEDITELYEVRDGIILLDEAQTLLNSRKWESLPDEFSYKLQQHRKHQLDLYATAQNMGTIDINYRRLVQKWVHHERTLLSWQYRGKEIFTFFRAKAKDIDYLYNSVDDLTVPDLKSRYFTIHKFKKRLYDTFYDIGFKRFRTIWINNYDKNMKREQLFLIIPKKLKLKDALRDIRLLNSLSGLNKSKSSPKSWNRSAINT